MNKRVLISANCTDRFLPVQPKAFMAQFDDLLIDRIRTLAANARSMGGGESYVEENCTVGVWSTLDVDANGMVSGADENFSFADLIGLVENNSTCVQQQLVTVYESYFYFTAIPKYFSEKFIFISTTIPLDELSNKTPLLRTSNTAHCSLNRRGVEI